MKLYELTEQIHNLLSDADNEDNQKELQAELDKTYQDMTEKLEAYAAVVKQLDANENALKAEKERFDNRLRSVRNHKEKMKYLMVSALQLVPADSKGKRRIIGQQFSLSLAKNPIGINTEACDMKQLPVDFIDFVPKIKAKDLIDHIKETGDLPAGAVIKEEKWSVRIR